MCDCAKLAHLDDVCVCVYVCVCVQVNTHTHSLSLSHTHTLSLSLSHTHTLSLSLSHTHTLSLSLSHTHTHTHTHHYTAAFRPLEKLQAVREMVCESLTDPTLTFSLSAFGQLLKSDSDTLAQLGLVSPIPKLRISHGLILPFHIPGSVCGTESLLEWIRSTFWTAIPGTRTTREDSEIMKFSDVQIICVI